MGLTTAAQSGTAGAPSPDLLVEEAYYSSRICSDAMVQESSGWPLACCPRRPPARAPMACALSRGHALQ